MRKGWLIKVSFIVRMLHPMLLPATPRRLENCSGTRCGGLLDTHPPSLGSGLQAMPHRF